MEKYVNIVKFWLKEFIDDEQKYSIRTEDSKQELLIEISVVKSDMGKIIGKNGNIITSLRNFINSISKKDKKNVKIIIKDI